MSHNGYFDTPENTNAVDIDDYIAKKNDMYRDTEELIGDITEELEKLWDESENIFYIEYEPNIDLTASEVLELEYDSSYFPIYIRKVHKNTEALVSKVHVDFYASRNAEITLHLRGQRLSFPASKDELLAPTVASIVLAK